MREPRKLPDVPLSPCPPGYARCVGHGWDTVQQAYALHPTPFLVSLLERAQAQAREVDDGDGVVVVEIGGRPFKVTARGVKRFRWRFENDDFSVFVAEPRPKNNWALGVRFTPAGLFEHGWQALRKQVSDLLRPYTVQREADHVRVSRADYCFDFYSPALAAELLRKDYKPHVVMRSRTKQQEMIQVVGTGQRIETLTLGTRATFQLQLYEKTREITEQSGKTWLYDVWAANMNGEQPWGDHPRNVYRLEARMFSDFLKDRNCRRPDEVENSRERLIGEILHASRLVVPQQNDTNYRRWAMHPIWSDAFRLCGAPDMLPLGRMVTGARNALTDMAVQQIAGTIRSATVLACGRYDVVRAHALTQRAFAQIACDPKHFEKVTAALDRYSDVDEAR